MSPIKACPLPEHALLHKYEGGAGYTDCYTTEIARSVSHAEYVEAFYSGSLFKVERTLLAWFLSKPSTDAQVKELASGALTTFAAWRVEDRSADQLLLSDFRGSTRLWLMAVPEGAERTRLYFGSAVVPVVNKATGEQSMGFAFKALLGFHKLYSRALLGAARSRLAS